MCIRDSYKMSLKVILAICLIVVTIIVLYIMLKKGEFIQEGLIYSLDIKSDQPSTDLTGKNEKMEFIMPVTQSSPNPFEGKGETGVIGHLKTLRTPPSDKMTIVMWINPKNLEEEAYLMQLGRSTANIEGEFAFRIVDQ